MIDNTVWFIVAVACYFLGRWISEQRHKRKAEKNRRKLIREVLYKILYNPFIEKWQWTKFNPKTRTWEWFKDATEEEVKEHGDKVFPELVFNEMFKEINNNG